MDIALLERTKSRGSKSTLAMDSLPDHLLMHCMGRLSQPDLAVVRCVCRRFHALLSVESVFDHRAREGFLEPWLCVIGGVQEDKGELLAEMFDFKAKKWRPMPALPPNSFFNFSCVLENYNLYAVGGFVALSDCSSKMPVYNPRTNAWEQVTPMRELREACACGVIGGCIYVAGGYCRLRSAGQRVGSAEVYIPSEDQWLPRASMKEGRSCCASAVVAEKLYVIGGYGTFNVLQTVEMYDPAKDAWSSKANMPGLWILAGCAPIDSNIYVVGSDMIAMDRQELAVYDTVNDVWNLLGHIPFDQLLTGSKCSLWGCAVAAAQGKLHILGGASSYDGGGLNTVLVYDPSTKCWTTIRPMRRRRHGCAAVLINL